MNVLILNRESFSLPGDGWYQVAPLGEFPHAASGVAQVVDDEACREMVRAFGVESVGTNFAGLLIDFDHFSLDAGNRSEAAGWIVGLEARETGLWAKIRWSDLGEEAVTGGRYRFLSPVWSRSDCVDLGNGRLRPVRLLNAAVTNDPNLKGMVPLSNSRGTSVGIRDKGYGIRGHGDETLRNAEGGRRLKWELGNSPEDRHCPSCSALAGMVQSEAVWEAAGLRPKSGRLFCGEHCHCRLVETDEPIRGDLGSVGALYGGENLGNAAQLVKEAKWALRNNWTEEAREVSLEVRRAKAKKRAEDGDGDGEDQDAEGSEEERKKAEEKKKKARERARERIEERLRRG